MSKRLYVGNLNYQTTESQLNAAFAAFGTVATVSFITDRETGRPRGFAFVEMSTAEEAQAAIDGLNGQDLDGRSLNVSIARERSGGGGGGGRERW